MGLIDFPNPMGWFEGVKDENQKRELINSAASAAYSAQITFLWELGKSCRDAKGRWWSPLAKFLTLTNPKDLEEADNLAAFQTEKISSK